MSQRKGQKSPKKWPWEQGESEERGCREFIWKKRYTCW